MAEYTQEELDAIIAEKIEEAKKGLFTEDDLNKRVTAEIDRRVETGIKKGIETQKEKLEREISERLKMSAEELAKKDFEEKMSTVSEKEKLLAKKENKISAQELLTEASIPKAHYSKFLDILVSDDSESTQSNVANFIDMFNSTKTEIETDIKTKLSKVPHPNTGDGSTVVTKEEFLKMGYVQQLKFKTENPEKFKEFISK